MEKIIDYLRTAVADPDSPIYGSDLVPPIADLCEIAERLERVAEIAEIIQQDTEEITVEYLLAHGWERRERNFWNNPKIGGDYGADTALSMEMDHALNAVHELTGG